MLRAVVLDRVEPARVAATLSSEVEQRLQDRVRHAVHRAADVVDLVRRHDDVGEAVAVDVADGGRVDALGADAVRVRGIAVLQQHRPAGQQVAVRVPGVGVLIHRRDGDVERAVLIEVADRRGAEDAGLDVVGACTERGRGERRVRRGGEAGDWCAVAVQGVHLVAVHGDDLRIAVAVEVGDGGRGEAAVARRDAADAERRRADVRGDQRRYGRDERRAAVEVRGWRAVGVVDGDLAGRVGGDELERAVAVEVRHAQALLTAGVGELRPAGVQRRVVVEEERLAVFADVAEVVGDAQTHRECVLVGIRRRHALR